jgi:hypothetical protein
MSVAEFSNTETYNVDMFLKDTQDIELSFKIVKIIIFNLFRHFKQMIWILMMMITHTRQKMTNFTKILMCHPMDVFNNVNNKQIKYI